MNKVRVFFPLLALTALLGSCTTYTTPPTPEEQLRAAAASAQVTDLSISPRADGGLSVTGKLSGNPFALRVPPKWNGQSMLFAHGYVQPVPGAAEKVPDPAVEPVQGLFATAYAQGYLTADSAYGKVGYAVKEGVAANKNLRDFLVKAGSTKNYITGASMGGNIAVALLEKYPDDYAGGLSFCGVTPGWRSELRYLMDFRVVYDYFTKGTPYQLPGNGDFLTPNPALNANVLNQSVGGLFAAAAQGDKAAQAIIAQVARVTGAMPDPISFLTPLGGIGYGLADIISTLGGTGYSNVGKVYTGSLDDTALNAGVQRFEAAANSASLLDANYTATGKFSAKLLTVHNLSDPLVPYLLVPEFANVVAAAGNSGNLVQQFVDAKPVNLSDLKNSGPAHCYFSGPQISAAWNELRGWVEQGVKPLDGVNITNAK